MRPAGPPRSARRAMADPFDRLSLPAALWYFLALLLVAAAPSDPLLQLTILVVLAAGIALTGERRRLAGSLLAGLQAGLLVGVLTLVLHHQGGPVLWRWGWFAPTGEGLRWALCLGLGMMVIVLCSLLQTRAARRTSLAGPSPGLARTVLICAMVLGLLPTLLLRLRRLLGLSQPMASEAGGRLPWHRRVAVLAYAVLAEILEDSSNRTMTLSLLGAEKAGTGKTSGSTAESEGAAAAPALSTQYARRPRLRFLAADRPRRLRSWAFSLAVAGLLAVIVASAPRPSAAPATSFIPVGTARPLGIIAAAVLTALPFVVEGGERLWSRWRA